MALYSKPKDVRYVDMCIYIDNNAYREDLTEDEKNTIYKYLYLISQMLAAKEKYFNNSKDYDNFAIFCATQTYLRLTNPKQYMLDENGEPKMAKLKSCLNYLKSTLFAYRITYQNTFFDQSIEYIDEEKEDVFKYNYYSIEDKINETLKDISFSNFNFYLGSIDKTSKEFLKRIPYYGDKKLWNNIYLSCMLSLLNSLVLSREAILSDKIQNAESAVRQEGWLLKNEYEFKKQRDSIILFHLNENMRDYITVLTRQLRHHLSNDLSLILHENVSLGRDSDVLAYSELFDDNGNLEDRF